jgi:primase-polymerase (primpol)-like protein
MPITPDLGDAGPYRRQAAALTLADLADRPIWVGWRQEMRKDQLGKVQSTKVPYDPRKGRRAKADDPATWATRAEAERWVATHCGDGVGIELSELDGGVVLCGVDLDTCRQPETRDMTLWAQEIVDRFATTLKFRPAGRA